MQSLTPAEQTEHIVKIQRMRIIKLETENKGLLEIVTSQQKEIEDLKATCIDWQVIAEELGWKNG